MIAASRPKLKSPPPPQEKLKRSANRYVSDFGALLNLHSELLTAEFVEWRNATALSWASIAAGGVLVVTALQLFLWVIAAALYEFAAFSLTASIAITAGAGLALAGLLALAGWAILRNREPAFARSKQEIKRSIECLLERGRFEESDEYTD